MRPQRLRLKGFAGMLRVTVAKSLEIALHPERLFGGMDF